MKSLLIVHYQLFYRPGLRSIVTGYLPSFILNGFIYIVPFAILGMAKLAGCSSKSKEEIKACDMVFYFLVGNLFFLSLISGSLLDEIGESINHPKGIPAHLASAVSAQVSWYSWLLLLCHFCNLHIIMCLLSQDFWRFGFLSLIHFYLSMTQADFFVTYILTSGLSGFSLEILQLGLLSWDALKSCTFCRGKEKNPYLYSLPYFRVIPLVSVSVLIGMVYAVVAPLLLPFLIGYFCLGYAVFINQVAFLKLCKSFSFIMFVYNITA